MIEKQHICFIVLLEFDEKGIGGKEATFLSVKSLDYYNE